MPNKYIPKRIQIPQRVISFGEKMNTYRLAELEKARNKRQTIRARKLAKQSTLVAEDNDFNEL